MIECDGKIEKRCPCTRTGYNRVACCILAAPHRGQIFNLAREGASLRQVPVAPFLPQVGLGPIKQVRVCPKVGVKLCELGERGTDLRPLLLTLG